MEDNRRTGAIPKRSSGRVIGEKTDQLNLARRLLNLIKKGATGLEIVEFLKVKADLNAVDEEGRTALHHVVRFSSLDELNFKEIVQQLIEDKAELNVADRQGSTPLHYAVISGLKEIITRLIKGNANINVADKEGKTPLHHAVILGQIEVTALLLDGNEADINYPDKKGRIPLHYAVIPPYAGMSLCPDVAEELTELLIENAAKIDVIDKKGKTPLCYAVTHNATAAAKQLVSVILLENINTTKPDYIHEGTYLSKFWDRYLAEVKAMMEERNPGSRFSIYAFYVKDADELVATMTEKEFKGFKRSFNRADFVERFPTFSTYLKDKLEELAVLKAERDKFLDLSRKCKISSLVSSKARSADLNQDAQGNVLRYLSTTEIKKFLAASFYPPVPSTVVTSDADSNSSVTANLSTNN